MSEKNIEEIEVSLSKKGYPTMWERGGAATNICTATIITGEKGEKLSPLYVRKGGELAGKNHALFIVKEGYYILEIRGHKYDPQIIIKRILNINGNKVKLQQVAEYSKNEWDNPPPSELETAIAALKEKGQCYHCRTPHYALL